MPYYSLLSTCIIVFCTCPKQWLLFSEFKYTMMKDDCPVELEITVLVKNIGVHFDPSMTFSTHCEQ